MQNFLFVSDAGIPIAKQVTFLSALARFGRKLAQDYAQADGVIALLGERDAALAPEILEQGQELGVPVMLVAEDAKAKAAIEASVRGRPSHIPVVFVGEDGYPARTLGALAFLEKTSRATRAQLEALCADYCAS